MAKKNEIKSNKNGSCIIYWKDLCQEWVNVNWVAFCCYLMESVTDFDTNSDLDSDSDSDYDSDE